jgi:LPXTG-motif cell wall-anchored protein
MPVVTYTIEGTYENTATAEDPGEVDLFEKKLATATVIYIPEEEPPYNPVTGQGGIWAAIMGALAAVTVALGLFGRRRRAMYRR